MWSTAYGADSRYHRRDDKVHGNVVVELERDERFVPEFQRVKSAFIGFEPTL